MEFSNDPAHLPGWRARYGWMAFLLANIAMIGFALAIARYGPLVQQLGFLATSVLGM